MFKKLSAVILAVVLIMATPLVAFAESADAATLVENPFDKAELIDKVSTFDVGDHQYVESETNDYMDYADMVYSDYTVSGYMSKGDMDLFYFYVYSKVNLQFILMSESPNVIVAFYNSNGDRIKALDQYYSDGNYFSIFDGTAEAGGYYIGVQPTSSASYSEVFYMFYLDYSSVAHTHSYTNDCDATCNICGATRSVSHQYSNACDDECNVCFATRTVTHSYSNVCDNACNICFRERRAPHSFADVYDEQCDLCGYECVAIVSEDMIPTVTGVYSFEPDSYIYGLDKDDYAVYDQQGKEVKYNNAKGGFPLVKDLTYKIRLWSVEYAEDFENWNYDLEAETIFPDTTAGAWYTDAVTYSVGAGIIGGYSNGKFGTSDSIQRQDFLVILARLSGVNLNDYNYRSRFPDVTHNSYYESAVNWGADNGIVTGYQNGKFGVGDKVTREQLVTFLCRYADYTGASVGYSSDTVYYVLNQYSDFTKVSDFAEDAVLWAIENGVISGKTSTTIVPQGNAQRCEVAKIMYNIFLNDIF